MRGIILILAVLAASPAAAKCHLFSVWHYPWAQRCGMARVALHHLIVDPPRNDLTIKRNDFEIPLPSLARADLDGGEADEAARGRLLLRATLEAANAH